jgi:Protein kinase domain
MPAATLVLEYQRRSNSQSTKLLTGQHLLITRGIWWAITLAACIFFVAALPIYFEQLRTVTPVPAPASFQLAQADAEGLMSIGISVDAFAAFHVGLALVRALLCVLVGLLIFFRKPNERMTLIASLTLILMGVFASSSQPLPTALISADARWFFPVTFIYSITGYMILLFFSTFPTGRFVPRWMLLLNIVWFLWVMVTAFFPQSPLDIQSWSKLPILLTEFVFFGLGIHSQYYRYRYVATPAQRQQSKWIIFGAGAALVLGMGVLAIVVALFPQATQPGLAHALFITGERLMVSITLSILAFAVALSILRYRLWEIDVLINRSLVYGLITLVLGAVFFGSVLLIQQIAQWTTGQMASPVALALAALLIGALFQPVQQQLRHFVNRRIYHLVVDPDRLQKSFKPVAHETTQLAQQMLGQYTDLEPIGRGGMGEVYRAWQASLNRTVAIKVLARHLADEAEYITRFEREAKAVASLQHPNIVQIYALDASAELAYMVMEYIEGDNLAMLLKQCGALPVAEVRRLVTEIAAALDYVHEHGLIHRDIKPSNVMLRPATNRSMQPILMDFGVARLLSSQTRVTSTGLVGTLDYAAPEQIMSAHEVDHRADIYALGVMTFQMLAGRLPFEGEKAAQVLFAHLYKPAPDIRDFMPDIPETVALALEQALAKDPQARFDSAGAFAAALY